MKIIHQWHFGWIWGIALLSVFGSPEYWGFTVLGIVVEFPRTKIARDIHKLMDSDESWQASEALLKR